MLEEFGLEVVSVVGWGEQGKGCAEGAEGQFFLASFFFSFLLSCFGVGGYGALKVLAKVQRLCL